MKANAQPLQEILYSNSQFLIPFFQRSYSWERDNWERLGNDIQSLLSEDQDKKHFLGPLVCALVSAVPGKTPQYQLIDGQQRLTTLSLILIALRDESKRAGEEEFAAKIEEQYLVNRFEKGLDRYKLVPRTGDRELYAALIDQKKVKSLAARLVVAHDFFRKFIRTHAHQDSTYLRRLFDTVVGRLYLVAITLDEEDPYEIFESLNSTGLPLQESDLIRNFLFMKIPLADQEKFQLKSWAPFEDEFEPSAGDVAIAPTAFYRDFLMRSGQYSKARETFSDFKKYFEKTKSSPAESVAELHRFVEFAKTIANHGKGLPAKATAVLRQFAWMEANTANPVMLNLLDQRASGSISSEDFIGCVSDLNSFILRRSMCGESTRAYGKWFCELAGELTGNVREKLQGYLLHRGWPDDETFERSLASFPIYRREFKKCRIVLEALERADGHKELVDLTDGIQIEHVMPQKLPGGAAGKGWREMLGEQYKKVHERWLDTIGNLTLTGYNQTLSNRAFNEKKKELCESKLTLNKIFARTQQWGEQQITERAAGLCPQVSKLWPRPSSDIEYTPPTKKTDGTNKVRERRKQYWASLAEMLEGSGVSLRPVRKCEVRTCDFFLPMADVNLSAQIVPNKKQLVLQLRFARARGREIFSGLEADREAIDEQFTTQALWEAGSKPTITWVLQGVAIRDRYDWLEHHSWLVKSLMEFEQGLLGRLRSLHEAVKEKSATKQMMLDFWIGFHARMFERGCELLATTPLPQQWNNLAIGKSEVWTYAHIKPPESQLSAWMIMNTAMSPVFFPQLEANKAQFESEFGHQLEWQKEGLKQWRIGITRSDVSFDDREQWQAQHDWLIDQLSNFDRVFRDRIQTLEKAGPVDGEE